MIPGGPSEKVGLMAGDRIVMVNDSLFAGKGLIIDLRDNTGGYMEAATRMVNEFLPEGKLIVYTPVSYTHLDVYKRQYSQRTNRPGKHCVLMASQIQNHNHILLHSSILFLS